MKTVFTLSRTSGHELQPDRVSWISAAVSNDHGTAGMNIGGVVLKLQTKYSDFVCELDKRLENPQGKIMFPYEGRYFLCRHRVDFQSETAVIANTGNICCGMECAALWVIVFQYACQLLTLEPNSSYSFRQKMSWVMCRETGPD